MKCTAFEISISNGETQFDIDNAKIVIKPPKIKVLEDISELITVEFEINDEDFLSDLAKFYDHKGWNISFRCQGDEESVEYEDLYLTEISINMDQVHGEAAIKISLLALMK